MDLGNLTLFKLVGSRMSYLGERQKVLSQNIANADTPYFRPSDLKPMNFQEIMRGDRTIKPIATNPMHLAGLKEPTQFTAEKTAFGKTYETKPNGNSVVLEEQMLKVSELQTNYQLAANLYQKNLGMLRTAIGRAQ